LRGGRGWCCWASLSSHAQSPVRGPAGEVSGHSGRPHRGCGSAGIRVQHGVGLGPPAGGRPSAEQGCALPGAAPALRHGGAGPLPAAPPPRRPGLRVPAPGVLGMLPRRGRLPPHVRAHVAPRVLGPRGAAGWPPGFLVECRAERDPCPPLRGAGMGPRAAAGARGGAGGTVSSSPGAFFSPHCAAVGSRRVQLPGAHLPLGGYLLFVFFSPSLLSWLAYVAPICPFSLFLFVSPIGAVFPGTPAARYTGSR